METWRCVRRGYGHCVVGQGRYSMFPYPLKSLGGDCTTPWEDLQEHCWRRHISSCLRWPGHYSCAPYPYFSSRHFSLNRRPPFLFESGTQFLYYNWRPEQLSNTSLIHLSRFVMNSERDEPSSKRRKHQGTIKRNWEYYLCSHNKENMKNLEDGNVDSTCEDREDKFDFSVMSYNILSQDFLEDNSRTSTDIADAQCYTGVFGFPIFQKKSNILMQMCFAYRKFKKIIMGKRSGQVWNHWVIIVNIR